MVFQSKALHWDREKKDRKGKKAIENMHDNKIPMWSINKEMPHLEAQPLIDQEKGEQNKGRSLNFRDWRKKHF